MLLRQVATERHSDLDLASSDAGEPCADGAHELLSGELSRTARSKCLFLVSAICK